MLGKIRIGLMFCGLVMIFGCGGNQSPPPEPAPVAPATPVVKTEEAPPAGCFQIQIFSSHSEEDVQKDVNKWLIESHKKKRRIESVQHSSSNAVSSTGNQTRMFTVMIQFRNQE